MHEPDSHIAERLVRTEPDLILPDFWLNEATNVLWLQVRRNRLTADDAREGLELLRAQWPTTPTMHMNLHEQALEIGMAIGHSTYDTLYVAFSLAVGAKRLIVADGPFAAAMGRHPDPRLATLLMPLADWNAENPR